MQISISKLDESDPSFDIAINWIHDEWGVSEGRCIEETKERILNCIDCPPPQIATIDSQAVGLISFIRFKLEETASLEVWLDALYVDEKHRGKGIAAQLVQAADSLASKYTKSLYTYTNIPEFYLKYGWTIFTPANDSGNTVLVKKLIAKNLKLEP